MNKIANWVFGSFFRTIGRLLVFVLLGFIIANLVDFSDIISNFRITDLFFEKVNASSVASAWIGDYSDSATGTWPYYSNNEYVYSQKTMTFGTYYHNAVAISTDFNVAGHGSVYITGYIRNLSLTNEQLSCTQYDSTGTICQKWTNKTVQIDFTLWAGNYTNQCKIDWNNNSIANYSNELYFTATCDFSETRISQLNYNMNIFSSNASGNYYFGLNRSWKYEITSEQAIINNQNQNTQDVIDNQNQNAQQQHQDANKTQETIQNATNETIATITDDTSPDINGTLDNDTVAGWLPAGPLDSLVNLPLTLFNSLTRAMGGTCADLVVPLPFVNKNLNIPCMSGIYSSMGFGSFFNWIGVIASAFILFSYLMKLYKWVDDTLTFRENNHLDNWGGV